MEIDLSLPNEAKTSFYYVRRKDRLGTQYALNIRPVPKTFHFVFSPEISKTISFVDFFRFLSCLDKNYTCTHHYSRDQIITGKIKRNPTILDANEIYNYRINLKDESCQLSLHYKENPEWISIQEFQYEHVTYEIMIWDIFKIYETQKERYSKETLYPVYYSFYFSLSLYVILLYYSVFLIRCRYLSFFLILCFSLFFFYVICFCFFHFVSLCFVLFLFVLIWCDLMWCVLV